MNMVYAGLIAGFNSALGFIPLSWLAVLPLPSLISLLAVVVVGSFASHFALNRILSFQRKIREMKRFRELLPHDSYVMSERFSGRAGVVDRKIDIAIKEKRKGSIDLTFSTPSRDTTINS